MWGRWPCSTGCRCSMPTGASRSTTCVTWLPARIPLCPELRRRLAPGRGPGTRPTWVEDHHFDVRRHVRATTLSRAGRSELLAHAATLHATPLPRDRPLWDLHFVDGLPDDRVALVMRVHHAMGDGIASVRVAGLLLEPARAARSSGAPGAGSVLRGPGGLPAIVRGAGRLARAAGSFAGPTMLAPRLSLNRPVGPLRRLETTVWSRADIRSVTGATGAGLNDVVIAIVGGAVARLLAARHELGAQTVVNVACPVSTRTGAERYQLGNRVSMLFVPVPVGIDDPMVRLDAVRDAAQRRRRAGQHHAVAAMLGAGNAVPWALAGGLVPLAHAQPFANLVVTCIPGPRAAQSCLGAALLEAAPVVPLAQNLSLSVGVLSYRDRLGVGVLCDPVVLPDLDVFLDGLHAAADELVHAAAHRAARGVARSLRS